MKEHIRSIYTFEAIDGTTFDTRVECQQYEDSLPDHLVFCLEQGYTAEQLREVATFEIGYTTTRAHTEYETPGFLREGGEYTTYHQHDTILEVVIGELSDVVTYALSVKGWTRKDRFIRKIKVIDLTC